MMSRVTREKPSLHELRRTTHGVSAFAARHNSASMGAGKASDMGNFPMAPRVPSAGAVKANTDVLFSTLYAELHRLARRQLARQWTPAALGVTTLLHEAYLNLAKSADVSFPDSRPFHGLCGTCDAWTHYRSFPCPQFRQERRPVSCHRRDIGSVGELRRRGRVISNQ